MSKYLLALLFFTSLSGVAQSDSYDYPIRDRFAATVVGTPSQLHAKLPRTIPVKVYQLPGLREAPPLLWHQQGLRFSAALQSGPAPLVFNIAGTGAAYDAAKMKVVQKALYQSGFHVINLSSPTHLNFQVNASRSMLPGYPPTDAADLYDVMKQAYDRVAAKAEISAVHITGYSLGGLHAAFVAKLDQQRKQFGIDKVLMINPPVNLYNSVKILDQMLDDNIEGGVAGSGQFLNHAIQKLAAAYEPDQGMRFDGDFLYNAYRSLPEEQRGPQNGRHGAAALIAFSFRISSGSLVFTGDLLTRNGYIVPKNKQFHPREPVDYYAAASHRVTFQEYVDDLVIPDLLSQYPGKTRDQLLAEASLKHIQDYLEQPSVYAVTNRDEIILESGELEYLQQTLGERLRIYPAGGHCGNMAHRDNIAHMIAVLRGHHG